MSENEITPAVEQFLAAQPNLILATLRRDGVPQLSPVWYLWREGAFFISTDVKTAKWRNLVRDPRLSVCVLSEPLAASYVTITGTAEIMDDDSIWPITQSIVERYVRPDGVEARMRNLRRQNRVPWRAQRLQCRRGLRDYQLALYTGTDPFAGRLE